MTSGRFALVLATALLALLVGEAAGARSISPASPLTDLPFRLGPWSGWAEGLDAQALARVRPDQYVNRRYRDGSGRSVLLYVGYYSRGASRGQAHAVCFGACEEGVDLGREPIVIGGEEILVNRAGVLWEQQPAVVLYWFHQGRDVLSDPYRSKLERARRALLARRTDGAIVRVTAAVDITEEEAWRRAESFAALVLPVVRDHLPR